MKATLLTDILSNFYSRQETVDNKGKVKMESGPRVYGKRGEEVRIVADYENVVIVENKSLFRYPVKREELEIK